MKRNFTSYGKLMWLLVLCLITGTSFAQDPFPVTINNPTDYPDEEVYIAIVGEDLTGPPGAHVWVDVKTGIQYPMNQGYNTVPGPVYQGNMGPGGNGLYADCFTRLSDIPDHTVMLHPIQGCRIYIAFEEQLYFYFFGSSGTPRGYTAPNSTDPTDPNQGILYEVIELTYNEYGFFGNPTRVDSYKAPIGMELFGHDGYYKKVGEIATHEEIISLFPQSVPEEFQMCLDPQTGEIKAPSKTPEFADGSIGTMPEVGPYADYFKPYIDQIWEKYAHEDLIFDSGDAGIWQGRVQGEQLILESVSEAFMGRQGIITRRPTTQEAFEGRGVLDNVVQDATTDLLVQAQITAAINRHVIDVTTPNIGLQDWSNAADYYQESPCNHYAKFWHMAGISVDQLSYGFAYDDVWDYSPSVHTPEPSLMIITLGGYAGETSTLSSIAINPDTVTLINGESIQFTAQAYDQNGLPMNAQFTWSAANGAIDQNGLYQATSEGTYQISASNQGISGYAIINVLSNTPVLTTITVSPQNAGVSLKDTLQFTAEGWDQFGNPVSIDPEWSTTGGSIDPSGLFTADEEGTFTVTAIVDEIQGSTSIAVSNSGGICTGGPSNGDYTYEITGDTENPSITFQPGYNGVGDNIVILYYGTSPTGGYPGYIVSPGVPYQLTASEGQTIYFYYTYSVPEGGERNTSQERHDFTVGQCGPPPVRVLSSISITPADVTIAPNQSQQFTAEGFDQFGDSFAINPIWNSSGGNISSDGLFFSSSNGVFTISCNDGSVSSSTQVNVSELSGQCSFSPSNGDYVATVSNDPSNPTITFEAGRPGIGDNIVILYYQSQENGSFPGYIVPPGQPYGIDATSGETIFFYYTYSVPEGGENNSYNERHHFEVGNCHTNARLEQIDEPIVDQTFMVFPNPTTHQLNFSLPFSDAPYELSIIDLVGRTLMKQHQSNPKQLDISMLKPGKYILKINAHELNYETVFIKM